MSASYYVLWFVLSLYFVPVLAVICNFSVFRCLSLFMGYYITGAQQSLNIPRTLF